MNVHFLPTAYFAYRNIAVGILAFEGEVESYITEYSRVSVFVRLDRMAAACSSILLVVSYPSLGGVRGSKNSFPWKCNFN